LINTGWLVTSTMSALSPFMAEESKESMKYYKEGDTSFKADL
jgi:hypothetical protein